VSDPLPGDKTLRVDRIVVAASAVGVVLLAAVILVPLWIPVVFAAWTAVLLDPLARRIARWTGGRPKVGAGLVTAAVASLLVPVGLLVGSVVTSVTAFVNELMQSERVRHAVLQLVSNDPDGNGAPLDVERLLGLAQTHGLTAWRAVESVAGAGAWAVVVLFVFFVSLFELLVDGRAMWSWVQENAPLPRDTCARLAGAFVETGRGIFIGSGLESLIQAAMAMVLFLALGVPRAVVLAALTFAASFIPGIGTGLIFAPVAVGLALKGDYFRAAILAGVGLIGIGSVDNIMRPVLQRWGGKLDLPAFLLLLAAFGGLAAFGPAGLVLGPLALRMAKEVLLIAREAREREDAIP
jgi:predicted PurR-regulated permease PerM